MKTLLAAFGLLAVATSAATAASTAGLAGGRAIATARQAALCSDTGRDRPSCAPPAWTLTGGGNAAGGGIEMGFEP
jgi:hypothetical protein